jgi:hypothetical protein
MRLPSTLGGAHGCIGTVVPARGGRVAVRWPPRRRGVGDGKRNAARTSAAYTAANIEPAGSPDSGATSRTHSQTRMEGARQWPAASPSADGAGIAFTAPGTGPAVVIVDGAVRAAARLTIQRRSMTAACTRAAARLPRHRRPPQRAGPAVPCAHGRAAAATAHRHVENRGAVAGVVVTQPGLRPEVSSRGPVIASERPSL